MATSSCKYPCKDAVREFALSVEFAACGFAAASPVERSAAEGYRQWLDQGKNGPMDYLRNHMPLRDDPAELLPGARTVVSLALNYYPALKQRADAPQFAYYAYGRDYHEVVRERLRRVADFIGAPCRCCVDTAPMRERYWASRAGIGFVGRNNQLIIPGKGSFFFLGEVVTTAAYEPDEPAAGERCGGCRRCVDACPAGALSGDYGALDARRCLSCLTIEHRGDLPPAAAARIGNRVYGCDECQLACPHNRFALPTAVADFAPSPEFLALDRATLASMSPADFSRLFRHSAVKRAKLSGLLRNLAALRSQESPANP